MLSLLSNTYTNFSSFKDYFCQDFQTEIDISKNYSNRKTSFDNIDHYQIFSTSLYLIGAAVGLKNSTELSPRIKICIYTCVFSNFITNRLTTLMILFANSRFFSATSIQLSSLSVPSTAAIKAVG